MTTTTTRKSRASRAAKQADQDQQPKPEQCPHDLDPATCAECNGSAEAERKAEARPEPKPAPTGPYAQLSGVEVHVPVFRGVVKVTAADGEVIETIECGHPWAHTTPEIAVKCARKIASGRGLRIA